MKAKGDPNWNVPTGYDPNTKRPFDEHSTYKDVRGREDDLMRMKEKKTLGGGPYPKYDVADIRNSLLKLMKETIEEGGAAEQINRLKGTEQYNLPFNVEYRPATADDVADDIETLATEHGPMHVVQHRGPSHEPPNLQNTVENSLLKLMKGDDDQRLNAMSDDKVKEHDEENILVADGDKTGDAMKRIAKLMKYGDVNPTDVGMTKKNALELDKANGAQPPKMPKQSNLPQQAPTMSASEIETQNRPQDANQAGVGESIGAISDLLSGRAKQQVWGQKLTENQMKQNPGAKVGGSGDYSLQAQQQQRQQNTQTPY